MKTWRLLDMPPMTAAENMALDETLLQLKGKSRVPNTLRFLQFSPPAVLVGYHQSVAEEIRTEYCRERGIDINRRVTGGGAIFFDENQLGWEVICDKSFFNVTLPNNRLFQKLCQPVIAALGTLGIRARFRPRNDIEVNGRKISGTGGTESGDAFMFQGTLLMDFDADTMLRALRIPVEKLKAKEVDSVKERVTCLRWELGDIPSLQAVKHAICRTVEQQFGIRLVRGGLEAVEKRIFEKKLRRFRSNQWIRQGMDSVKPKYSRKEAVQSVYKAAAGMIRFTLVVNLPQRRIKDIYITGDFLSFPSRALYDLEACLRGSTLDREGLYRTIRQFFDSGRIQIPDMDFEDFVKPLDQALEKIKITQFGIPLEHCNLISVANGSFETVVAKAPSVLLLPYCAKLTECDQRYQKGCRLCDKTPCSIGPAWRMGLDRNMRVVSVTSFEDLWAELLAMKKSGVRAYIGCCCQPFFAKHVDDFEKSGLPGILLDIDNSTCYDLDQAKQAYAGQFENQTQLNLPLLNTVLTAAFDANSASGPPL